MLFIPSLSRGTPLGSHNTFHMLFSFMETLALAIKIFQPNPYSLRGITGLLPLSSPQAPVACNLHFFEVMLCQGPILIGI